MDMARPSRGLVGVARHFRLAEAAQRACPDIPVVGTGYSYLRQYAVEAGEANLRDGRVSIVGHRPRRDRVSGFRARRADGQEKGVHHGQLLHDADAREGQRARPICRRMRAPRSGIR